MRFYAYSGYAQPIYNTYAKINAINDTNLRKLHICIDRFGHFSTVDKEN